MGDFVYNFTKYFDSWITYISSFLLSLLISKLFCYINKRIIQKKGILYAIFLLISYFLIALPVALTIGMRERSVGFDTYNYYRSYERMKSNLGDTLASTTNKLEIGFIFLRWIVFKVTGGAEFGAVFPMTLLTVMIMCHAFSIWGKKIDLTLGLFIYYCVFGLNLCDQSRQLLAAAILAVAIHSLYYQKTVRYILLVLLAASVHVSALIGFFLTLFFGMEKKSLRDKIPYFFMSVVVAVVLLINVVLERYGSYVEVLGNNEAVEVGMAWILDMSPIIIPILLIKSRDSLSKKFKIFVWSAIPFRMLGYVSYFIMRMYYYPAIISWVMLLADCEAEEYNKNYIRNKAIIIVVCVVYFGISYILLLQHNVVPYERIQI